MKNIILIAGGTIGSFVVVLLIGLGLLYMKPELFVSVPVKSNAVTDSVKVKADSAGKAGTDTAAVAQVPPSSETPTQHGLDTLLVAKLTEKAKTLELVVDSLRKHTAVIPVKPDTAQRPDWKATAKLIESMNPEEAGKVLKQMSDTDVKQVIAKVKAKQAGKILANLEPDRVARIIR
jgi:hypothetical protein